LSLRQVFDEFDRMFEDMQQQLWGSAFGGRPWGPGVTAWTPRLDVEEKDGELVLTVELPGFAPDEVSVDCTEDVLTIHARGTGRSAASTGRSPCRAAAISRR
jgi:HSP20 family protein